MIGWVTVDDLGESHNIATSGPSKKNVLESPSGAESSKWVADRVITTSFYSLLLSYRNPKEIRKGLRVLYSYQLCCLRNLLE